MASCSSPTPTCSCTTSGAEREDVCAPDVGQGEYRTAPLWGLRHRSSYLHDAAARDLTTAISLHGGEAEAARDAFLGLDAAGQAAVLRFLESL